LIERQGVAPLPFGEDMFSVEIDKKFPEQMNGYDCGVFVLKGIDSLSRFGRIIFDQKDVPLLRYLICYELIIGNFLPYDKQTP
jgi:Ulp1 family protease